MEESGGRCKEEGNEHHGQMYASWFSCRVSLTTTSAVEQSLLFPLVEPGAYFGDASIVFLVRGSLFLLCLTLINSYIVVAKKELTVSIAFTAISLFSMLRMPLNVIPTYVRD